MADQYPASGLGEDELEMRAEEQRYRLGRCMADLRRCMHDEFDVRGRVKDGVHARPGAFYGAAAGAAVFIGYILARALKV